MLANTVFHPDGVYKRPESPNPAHDVVPYQGRRVVTIHRSPQGMEVHIDHDKQYWTDPGQFAPEDWQEQPKSARGEGDRERSIERAARRAKTRVRRLCKAAGFDCMLTLTYRENMQDFDRLIADFKAFRKRLGAFGPFHYVATVERQKRGAYHLHIACKRFPAWLNNEAGVRVKSFNLIRSMWRRVVGADNGAVRLSQGKGNNGSHRIASYISKYITKDIDDAQLNKKRYWASPGIPERRAERFEYPLTVDLFDIIGDIYRQALGQGYLDVAQYADMKNGFNWFSFSIPPKGGYRG